MKGQRACIVQSKSLIPSLLERMIEIDCSPSSKKNMQAIEIMLSKQHQKCDKNSAYQAKKRDSTLA